MASDSLTSAECTQSMRAPSAPTTCQPSSWENHNTAAGEVLQPSQCHRACRAFNAALPSAHQIKNPGPAEVLRLSDSSGPLAEELLFRSSSVLEDAENLVITVEEVLFVLELD